MSDFGMGRPQRGGHGGGHGRGHGGGHGHHGHHGHHRKHHHHQPPPPPDGGGGGGGGDGDGGGGGGGDGGSSDFDPMMMSPDDGGGDDMGFESGYGGTNYRSPDCGCGGTGGSCHCGPDLGVSNHLAPMGQEEDDFGCDPLGSCSGRYRRMMPPSPYGWEFDGPGNFGGELSSPKRNSFSGDMTYPILNNWGRYPSGSPLTGIFAGDMTRPILSNWGRYPSGSPLTGIFAGDDSTITMPMDTITGHAPSGPAASTGPSASSGAAPDNNPTTSGLGGILDAVSTVAQGVSSVVAATHGPPAPPPLPPGHPMRPRPHRHAMVQPPFFAPAPPYAGRAAYYPPPPPPIPYRRPAGYPPGYIPGYIGYPYDLGY
jgi:hypothetical protein